MAAQRFGISGLILMLTGLLLAGPVQAVTFSVGGWEDQFPSELTVPDWAPHGVDGYPGDTVEFIEHSGEFELVDGAVFDLKINTLLRTIDYTWGGGVTEEDWQINYFDFNPTRTISFGGVEMGSVSQAGHLETRWHNDYLSFAEGTASTFLVEGFQVKVTPLAMAEIHGTDFSGGSPWPQLTRDMMARFELSAVPEPGALLLVGLGIAVAGAARIRSGRKGQ